MCVHETVAWHEHGVLLSMCFCGSGGDSGTAPCFVRKLFCMYTIVYTYFAFPFGTCDSLTGDSHAQAPRTFHSFPFVFILHASCSFYALAHMHAMPFMPAKIPSLAYSGFGGFGWLNWLADEKTDIIFRVCLPFLFSLLYILLLWVLWTHYGPFFNL